MIQKLYKFAYTTGTMFLILSILLSFVPPIAVSAGSGAVWTTTTACGTPQNDNQYNVGDTVFVHYNNDFTEGLSYVWTITNTSAPGNPKPQVANGGGIVEFLYDGGTEGCFEAYTIQPGDSGTFKVDMTSSDGTSKYDSYRVEDAITPTDTPTPIPPTLGVTVTKSANPTSVLSTGEPVVFSVSVTNDSNVTVQLVSLNDSIYGDLNGLQPGTCVTPQDLGAGETYNCNFTKTVSGTAGTSHTNIVEGIIEYNQEQASDTGSATVNIVSAPSISLEVGKSANPTSVTEPGGDVTFTVSVKNTSNVDVQLTQLSDSVYGNLFTEGLCTAPASIAAGATYTCDFTKYISAAHTNTVQASIQYGELTASGSASASVSYNLLPAPSITVDKSASPTVLDEPGGNATYTVKITNDSATQVKITSIADNKFGTPSTCAALVNQFLAPGASETCTFTEYVSGTVGNPHVNTVTVNVIDDLGKTATGTDDASVSFVPLPTITVSKAANPTSVSEYGANVAFKIVVTNTSAEQLTLNSLDDSVFGDLSGTCNLPQTLAANGGSYTCNFDKPLQGEPTELHSNTVEAIAVDLDGNEATGRASATVSYNDELPSITVTKTAYPTSVDEPGGLVEFTFQIKNNSQESVWLNSLTDTVFSDLNSQGTCNTGVEITAGETYSCSVTKQIDGNAGETHTNTVTAIAVDNDKNSTQGSATAEVNIINVPSSLQVTKTADPAVVAEPGGDVTFTVLVENLTFEELTLTSLSDDKFGDLSGVGTCDTLPIVIAGNSSYSCEFTETISGSAGYIHINEVTAIGHGNDQIDVSDNDSARVDVSDSVPEIQLTKSASPSSVPAPSGTVTYTVAIENQSQENVTLTSLVDDVFGDLNGVGTCATGGIILAGDTYTCTFDQTISGQVGDEHTNTITGIVVDNQDNETEGSDSETVTFTDAPEIALVDPCTIGCDLDEVTGEICNNDPTNDYTGAIEWTAYVDSTEIGSGTLNGIAAGTCVQLSAPRSGEGLYSITVNLVDEERTLNTSCGPLVCTEPTPKVTPTPTTVPAVNPPTGTNTDVFIPVTGVELGSNSLIQKLQNLGFAFFSIGLVLHGFSLQEKKDEKKQKKSNK
ncbi:hypothetical protein KQH54_03930 [bacterium]|nr:hypothetical protein [bacterium]